MCSSLVSNRLVALALLVGAGLAWGACRSPDNGVAASSTAVHAVQGAQLAEVMRQLGRLDRTLLLQDVDTAREQVWRLERIDELATALEASAGKIPGMLGDVELDKAQRAEFVGYAAALETRAGALAAAARSEDGDALRSSLDALQASCHDCHQRFRVAPLSAGSPGSESR